MDEAEPGLSRALGGLGSRERDFINSLSSLWAALCVLPSYHSFLVLIFFFFFPHYLPSKRESGLEVCGWGELLQGSAPVSSLCSVQCCSTLTFPVAFCRDSCAHLSHTVHPTENARARDEKQGEKPGGAPEVLFSRAWCAPSRLLGQTGAVTCQDLCVSLPCRLWTPSSLAASSSWL